MRYRGTEQGFLAVAEWVIPQEMLSKSRGRGLTLKRESV